MPEEHISGVMERTYAQRQERFIRLFLYTSPSFVWLRENRELAKRVAEICCQVAEECMPEQVTIGSYSEYVSAPVAKRILGGVEVEVQRPYRAQEILKERLMQDATVKQGLPADKLPSMLEARCGQIAHHVGEAHRYFLQKQLTSSDLQQQNISQ